MVLLKKLFFLFLPFLFISCAKTVYITKQSLGQISLLNRARDNNLVLKDVKVSVKDKDKIRKIQQYKEFFYNYFEHEETSIYSKTTMLKNDAVTYLVISSPYDKIKAEEECFPFVGCFPYLGFFEQKDAHDYAKNKEEEQKTTYIRPVYAYSTLGRFEDPILSSFFKYEDYDLAELIFHELFHTIFFVKDEVELNENLANYFGKKMAAHYFSLNEKQMNTKRQEEEKQRSLAKKVVELTQILDQRYKDQSPASKDDAKKILEHFLGQSFFPAIEKTCQALQLQGSDCFPLKNDWNNARFAAFLTYENQSQDIEKLHQSLGGDLKSLYHYIQKRYEDYLKTEEEKSFAKVLFLPMIVPN